MKKVTIVAGIAMAMAAVALPSTASARWLHNHNPFPNGVNAQVHGTGTALFTSQNAGSIHCTEVTTTAQMTGGQTTGHVEEFNALNPQTKCHTSHILAGCTVTSVQSLTLPWLAHVTPAPGTEVQVTGVHITNKLHGFLCPQHITLQGDGVEITGEEGATAGPHTKVQGITLTGQLTAVPGGPVKVEGTLTPTAGQQNTYGWTN